MLNVKIIMAKRFPQLFKVLSYIYHARLKRRVWLLNNTPMGTLVYIGANVGESVGKIYYKYSQVYCFEPNPINFKILQKKFENRRNVTLVNAAVSGVNGVAPFYLSDNANNFASSSLAKFSMARSIRESDVIEVQTIDFLTFFDRNNISVIDLLVTDTEGYDYSILRSMQALLTAGKIKKIKSEVVVNGKNNPFESVENYEHLFDDLLQPHFEKVASGWTELEEGKHQEVPSDYFFKDVMYVFRPVQDR